MAIKADEISKIIQSQIEGFDDRRRHPGSRDRHLGRRRHRPRLRPRPGHVQRAPRIPPRRHRPGPQPRGGQRRRRSSSAKAISSRKATSSSGPTGSCRSPPARPWSAASSIRSASPLDGKGPIKTDVLQVVERLAPGRRRPAPRPRAAPDRDQGHRRDDPHRPRPARADHRRPPDRASRPSSSTRSSTRRGPGSSASTCAIGQKNSTVAQFVKTLEDYGAMEYSHRRRRLGQRLRRRSSTWPPTAAAPWANISGTTAGTP